MNRFSLLQMARLPRLADLIMPSDRDFCPEKLITEVGLYEAVLIDAADIRVFDVEIAGEVPHLEVSRDVAALHKFINHKARIMLPCPDCKQDQPFDLRHFYNPQKVSISNERPSFTVGSPTRIPVYGSAIYTPMDSIKGEKINIFDPPKVPKYRIGQDFLRDFDQTQFEGVDFESFKQNCALACVDGIEEFISEVRRDFTCTLDILHCGFVDFIIYEAVDRYTPPEILRRYKERRAADSTVEMTMDEKKAAEAYERLKTCLIMEKVGQYPSMADLQMFDIEKYKTVLGRESFRDFRTAIGLYASGVGCGSFVYLRRIFEGIVVEAEAIASKMEGWDAEEYRNRDFNKKIEYLEGFDQKLIPDELSNVKTKIYGVLSRGVHASSDQECIELFPVMKYVIEELLDHKIAKKEREDKLKLLGSVLGNS